MPSRQRPDAREVLERFREENLPEFCEVDLIDVNQRGNFGNCPLHVAAVRGNIEEIVALLDGGAKVNLKGELGNTALHEATGQGHVEAVRVLLAHGASPGITNDVGATARDIAVLQGRKELECLL